MPNIEVEADPNQPVGSGIAYDAKGRSLGPFHVPGGRPPAGTVKVVLSPEDYDDMQRSLAGRAR